MFIIGENIHIVSEKVREALAARDREFFMDLAVKQVEAGAGAVEEQSPQPATMPTVSNTCPFRLRCTSK